MRTQLELEPYRADISIFAGSVFLSMVDLHVDPMDADLPASPMITGAVYYAGAWKGATLLQCDASTAFDLTARLMGVPRPESFDDDVRDAIGEISNIVAGNLKPLLRPGVVLSMPSVFEGPAAALRICAKTPVMRLALASDIGPIWISIHGLADD
jgi:CheY-specific phosphatase CheX